MNYTSLCISHTFFILPLLLQNICGWVFSKRIVCNPQFVDLKSKAARPHLFKQGKALRCTTLGHCIECIWEIGSHGEPVFLLPRTLRALLIPSGWVQIIARNT